jgi:hypothetical protein
MRSFGVAGIIAVGTGLGTGWVWVALVSVVLVAVVVLGGRDRPAERLVWLIDAVRDRGPRPRRRCGRHCAGGRGAPK